jgi:hypothetical protein
MMKYSILSIAVVLLIAGLSFAQSKESGGKCINEKVAALASRYKELRERRQRVPKGKFDQELDDDRGRFHDVLYSLGVELGRSPYTRQNIIECLGEPDAIKKSGEMGDSLSIYRRELGKADRKVDEKPGREYLIYLWRGWHDFLFFIAEDGMMVDHGWWFAYE